MRLSDALRGKRADLLDRMEALAKKAESEERLFTEDEQRAWDAGQRELTLMDEKLRGQIEAEELLRGGRDAKPVPGSGAPRLVDIDGNPIRTLGREEKLRDLVPHRGAVEEPASLGRCIRGLATGNWKNATDIERRAMGEGVASGGGVTVPQGLAAEWLDAARAKSTVLAAGARTIPMSTQTLTIPVVVTDPLATFRKEHAVIPESDLVLAPVTIRARLVGIIVRLSIELFEDSPMASAMIEQTMFAAMAAKIDWALLSGDGSTTGDLDNPVGITNTVGVHDIPFVAGDYASYLDAYAAIANSNGTPNALIWNPTSAIIAAKTATGLSGDKTQLVMPQPLDDLERFVTTALTVNGTTGSIALMGDFPGGVALAMRTGMTLETTRVGGTETFARAEILVRLYSRLDTAVLRPTWFSKISGIKVGP